jgi:hypothetical protein
MRIVEGACIAYVGCGLVAGSMWSDRLSQYFAECRKAHVFVTFNCSTEMSQMNQRAAAGICQ